MQRSLSQPAASADALKDLRAHRAQEIASAENSVRFPEDLGLNFRA
jgi:predicted component of type VI protein secretion system